MTIISLGLYIDIKRSNSSNTPTSNIPNISSSDATNPYLPYSESVYGVLD